MVGVVCLTLIYNQHQSDNKKQALVIQQKEVEKQKQEEVDKAEYEEKRVIEEQKKFEEEKKAKAETVKTEKAIVEKSKENANDDGSPEVDAKKSVFTKENAIEIVDKIITNKNTQVKIQYDHMQERNGKDYFVIRVYEGMSDHITTLGWYYVDGDTKKAYEWDLLEDKLKPIN